MTSVRTLLRYGLAVLFIVLAAAFDEPVHAVADAENWQARSGYWPGGGAVVRIAVVFVPTVVVAIVIVIASECGRNQDGRYGYCTEDDLHWGSHYYRPPPSNPQFITVN